MNPAPAPVVADFSAYIICGRVKSALPPEQRYVTSVRTPALGIADGIDAERLGFRRVWLAERYDLKEAGVLLGAIGAQTARVGLATGVVGLAARPLLMAAALGATMHAAFGPRFAYGIGRGAAGWFPGSGINENSYTALADYAALLKCLWRGETIDYHGPAGDYDQLRLTDPYEGPVPEIWYGCFGLPKSAAASATSGIDGVLLPAMLTPDGVYGCVRRFREACERAGRDPASLRVCASVVTAPELEDGEVRELCHARVVTYLQPPAWGRSYEIINGWDADIIAKLRAHAQFARMQASMADTSFHRRELAEPARLIPDSWMKDTCAIGSIKDCVTTLRAFREAGADEVTTYGSTPAQNAKLIAAWRKETTPV